MFLKMKFTASGEYDKLKTRLVADEDQEDKELYGGICLSSAVTCVFISARP